MSFISLNFVIFLVIGIGAYFMVPKKYQWCILLIASQIFYLLSSLNTYVFLLFTTVTTFYGGRLIERQGDKYKAYIGEHKDELDRKQKKEIRAQYDKKKQRIMLGILLFNFGILAFVKYFKVYINMLGDVLQLEWLHFDAGILIPLGISFYTFQSMGYIIDVYRGQYKADKSLAKFALFVSYFPQIIQGPISRYDQLADQLYEEHVFEYERVKFGAQLMLWGWFKKLVIADRISVFVNQVFDNYTDYVGFYLILAVIGYTIQIYGDFSGGMDIARGVSQIFGIDLALNFERPYFAKNIPEFWRRWHITLGAWCRDYIFYPISLSKTFGKLGKSSRKIFGERIGKLLPVIIAQLITFFTIGVWHGAEFKYIAYGLYQAVFIIGGIIFEPYLVKLTELLRINTKAFSWKLFQIIRTFGLVVFGRFFSRGVSFSAAIYMMKNCFVFNPGIFFSGKFFTLGLSYREFLLLMICLVFWIIVSIVQENGYSVRKLIAEQNMLFRWAVYLVGVFAIIIFGVYGQGYNANSFIYRGF